MKMKRMFACMLALALLGALFVSGCAGNQIAAKVGDREIKVKQLENYYNNSASYASYYGYTLDTKESVEAFQDYLLDSLISSEMTAYQARQAGLTLTDEEEQEAKKFAQESYDSTYQSFVDAAEKSGSKDVKAYAQKLFTDALVQNGTNVNEMKKDFLKSAEDTKLIEKHRAQLIENATLSAEELKAKYDEEVAAQEAAIAESPAMYFTYETNAMYGYSSMPLVIPEGMFRVKQILVEDEATAKQVEEKLKAGEDFDKLLAEYGTDPGMQGEENPNGYLVGEGANFVTAFLDAALALEKEGDLSDIVKSDYGYHIIKRMGDEPARVLPYEEVQEAFDQYEQNRAQDEYYSGVVEGWVSDEALVTRYPENYRSIGMAALSVITPAPEAPLAPAEGDAEETSDEDTAQ